MTEKTEPKLTTGVTVSNAVEHPAHYNVDPSGVECIEIIRHRQHNIGAAIKYLWRAGLKVLGDRDAIDAEIEDLEKARFYITDQIEMLKKQKAELPSQLFTDVMADLGGLRPHVPVPRGFGWFSRADHPDVWVYVEGSMKDGRRRASIALAERKQPLEPGWYDLRLNGDLVKRESVQ